MFNIFLGGNKISFKDIANDIKGSYNSAKTGEDLVTSFYNPVLSQSVRYDRVSGYFSSSSLAIASKGISKFIENNGKMRLICGRQLIPKDIDAIKDAEKLKGIINDDFLKDYESLEEGLKKNRLKLLSWMIAKGHLEIKIAINSKDPTSSIDDLVHTKTGLLYDENDEKIFFIGSVNETASGWAKNLEAIIVDTSWGNEARIDEQIDDFEKSWNGDFNFMKIMDVPEASLEKLIIDAPSDEDELKELIEKIEKEEATIKRKNEFIKEPFPHQHEAIEAWFENGKKGILAMATGTGKTLTSLWCLKKVLEEEDVLTVIACPYIHLIDQWKDELEALEIGQIHEFYGDADPKWGIKFDRLNSKVFHNLVKKPQIILTSQQSFHEIKFTQKIKELKRKIKLRGLNKKLLLIVDEVHHVGASKYSEGLCPQYDYRLGLSATPEKYMDYEGTQRIMNYFEGQVYEFNIMDALNRRYGDNNEPFLTPYCYHPIKVNLSDEEFNNKSKANNSEDKYRILKEILDELIEKNNGDVNHLIIFCSNKQLPRVCDILDEKQVIPKSEFTHRQDLATRKRLLKEFDFGTTKVLVAMRCLNEGVDVPSTDKVIIMSSSPNPAEYVQRRGRVLRRSPNKKEANIYDLIVMDKNNKLNKFFDSELERLIEFASTSSNERECMKKFEEWGLI